MNTYQVWLVNLRWLYVTSLKLEAIVHVSVLTIARSQLAVSVQYIKLCLHYYWFLLKLRPCF
jgi:hypothetical protein